MKLHLSLLTISLLCCFNSFGQLFAPEIKVMNTNGKVGIDTQQPIEKLHISEGNFRIQGFNTLRTFRFTETNNWQGAFVNYDGGRNLLSIGVHQVDDQDEANDNNVLNIKRSNGFVGINTIDPQDKLHISEGNLRIQGFNNLRSFRFTETNNWQGAFVNYDGGKDVLSIGVHHVDDQIEANDNRVLNIKRRNGFIGINTIDPKAKLHISEGDLRIQGFNNLRTFRFTENNNWTGAFINYDGGNDMLSIGVHPLDDQTEANDIKAFNIKRSNGFIGIHTTTQTHELEVNGTVKATTLKTNTNSWSDFVFDNDYPLPTLQEVEGHILEMGHLKDIPSAEEVAENGIDVAEMDAKLLQKIEELTLYTIQQQKELEYQQKENEALKSMLMQLVSRIETLEQE